ncbi:PRC-barrel domain-containing protein [Urbifossiella limnaea]|uniref:PRC-barrel domain protein n=1 Tax=Urbifossiella limnaea TaxID=2528023 RepID=A0A517XML4_9BACT|nr:PRC-barrel domain-containing protein [Urbifossiella limnaea]QDU18736.1 PRC-barrel domain protein [Urbifossiella limnaea]
MTRNLFRTLAATLAAAGVATAQQPAPAVQPVPVPVQPGTAVQPAQPVQPAANLAAYRAKDIIGTKVAIQSNTAVGTVDDIVFSAGGDVEYLIVAAADGKLTTVPWAAATFNPAQRTAVVDIPVQRWQMMPTYTVQAYPQFFTPTYRTEVYRAYGLTPGEFRRIERRIERR